MNTVEFLAEVWTPDPPGLILVWELATKRSRYLRSPVGATAFSPGAADLYTGVSLAHEDHGASRRTPNSKAVAIPGLWADIDVNGGPDNKTGAAETLIDALEVANLLCEPTLVVGSGYGLQAWWLFTEGPWRFRTYGEQQHAARAAAQWQELLRSRGGIGLDYTHDLARILRLPGTTNTKGGGRKSVEVLEVGPRHNRDELLALAADAGDLDPGYQLAGELVSVQVEARRDTTPAKLDWLIARSPKFGRTWRHERSDLPSMSEHDMAIASVAALAGCADQEIADLIVHHRVTRDATDEKATRVDYVARTIAKARIADSVISEPPAPVAKRGSYDAGGWASEIYKNLTSTATLATPMPFQALNDALDGGLLPGDVCLVAGYTSHGKTLLVDQMADVAADAGRKVHLYLTEMTAYQRGLRLLARRTGVPFHLLKKRELDRQQWEQVNAELRRLPYGCSIVADWAVDDVVEHITSNRWDLAVVDLIHGFHYSDERDLSRTSSAIVRAAKVSGGDDHPGTAIVCAAHLNDGQMRDSRSPQRPKPGLHSIKGASSLKQDADVVIFVWQEDDENGLPTGEGAVWIGKSRQGGFGSTGVQLDTRRMVFRERSVLEAGAR